MKIYPHRMTAEQVTARLDELVNKDKGWNDQCLAVLRMSGAPSPKTLTTVYLVCDSEASRWEGSRYRVGHTITVTV